MSGKKQPLRADLKRGLLGGAECVPASSKRGPKGYTVAFHEGRRRGAHVVVWLLAGRDIPEGMTLDHICHDPAHCAGGVTCPHRACVNIDHLRLATPAEQTANSTATYQGVCRNGHPWPENRITYPSGQVRCGACQRERTRTREFKDRLNSYQREWRAKKRARSNDNPTPTQGINDND